MALPAQTQPKEPGDCMQEICNEGFYAKRSRTVPDQVGKNMQMHVCSQLVCAEGHAWSRAIKAGGRPSELLPIGDDLGSMQLIDLPKHAFGGSVQAMLPGSGIIFVGAGM